MSRPLQSSPSGTQSDGHWWSRRWRAWLNSLGLSVADGASGLRVKRVEIESGRISGQVQDRDGQVCTVEVTLRPWSEEEWQRVLDALGSQALFVARLLAGDFPPELDSALAMADVSLLPESLDELSYRVECDEGTVEKPLPYVAAVCATLGEMVGDDPWLLFRLSGRDQQALLRALRNQRARPAQSQSIPAHLAENGRSQSGGYYHHVESEPEEAPPLEALVDEYWGSVKTQETFHPHMARPAVELAILRRLGVPAFDDASGEEAYELLAQIYRRVSAEAWQLAFASGPVDDGQ